MMLPLETGPAKGSPVDPITLTILQPIDIQICRSLIGPARLPLLTLVVLSPATIKQAFVLNAWPVY